MEESLQEKVKEVILNVPVVKARRMTKAQIRSASRRKRAAGNPGGKPRNVATFAKRGERRKENY